MAVLEESSEIITSDSNESIETEQGTEVDEPEEITTEETASVEEIIVIGLEGLRIKEITDIALSNAKSSCGFNHTWQLLNVINEGSCTEQAVFKVQCTVCGATGTVKTYSAEKMNRMFEDCTKLSTIYVNRANWNASFADTTDMFLNCGTSRVTPK